MKSRVALWGLAAVFAATPWASATPLTASESFKFSAVSSNASTGSLVAALDSPFSSGRASAMLTSWMFSPGFGRGVDFYYQVTTDKESYFEPWHLSVPWGLPYLADVVYRSDVPVAAPIRVDSVDMGANNGSGGLVGLTFMKPIVVGAPAAVVVVQANASQWMASSASVSNTVQALANTFTPAGPSYSAGSATYSLPPVQQQTPVQPQVSWQGPPTQMGSASQLWSSPATWQPAESGTVYAATSYSTGGTTYTSYADIPEPATVVLLGFGLIALGGVRKLRKS